MKIILTEAPDEPSRHIRSFVRRAGRTTSGQAHALKTLGPALLVPYRNRPLSLEQLFERPAPTVLEIGFGMGEATAQIAAALPAMNFIGCEVHVPGVGSLLRLAGEHRLGNVRIVQHDAIEVLRHMIPAESLAGVHLFFPDPWHKVRHHKRRLLQPEFCDLVASRVETGGYLHCATDWEPYARHMLDVLTAHPRWQNTADEYAPKPSYRPLTKFEQRGIRLGHGVWDLVFTRL
jgi:tRNA (guanine-N7-)-methyltransferase